MAGRQAKVPLLVGSNDWEEGLFQRFQVPLAQVLPPGVTAEQARAAYGVGPDQDQTLANLWTADTVFHAPALFLAREQRRAGGPSLPLPVRLCP